MIANFLRVSLRNLLRNKGFSAINIFGLSIGIICFLLMMVYVKHELSFDAFNENFKNIYRVNLKYDIGVNKFDESLGPVPLSEAMIQDFPEVIHSTRLYHTNYRGRFRYIILDDKQFKEEKFLYADSTVFDVFTIPLIKGNSRTALSEPYSVVLTEKTAEKYFGEDDPMGKLLKIDNGTVYKVTGITKGIPDNSHFDFELLASFSSLNKSRDPEWWDTAVYTYVVLRDGYPWQQLNDKLPEFSRKHVESDLQKIIGIPYDQFLSEGNFFGFFMEPLADVHLRSDVPDGFNKKGSINTVIVFLIIGFAVLFVACMNFINLSTSRSVQRANEVGVRKVIGSGKNQIRLQFLIESIMLTFISAAISLILFYSILPYFNSFINREISVNLLDEWYYIPSLILFIIAIGFLSGSYPAFLLSSFRIVDVLKNKNSSGTKGKYLRNGLVLFQYSISIILFIVTIVIYNQLEYMKNKELGYDKDQIIAINNAQKVGKHQNAFKYDLLNNSDIEYASYSDCLPQILLETKVFEKAGDVTNESHTLVTLMGDVDFDKTYGLKLNSGRYFDKRIASDSSAVVLNEAAVKLLNIKNTEDEILYLFGNKERPLKIIGVLKDFHLESLHYDIRPFAALINTTRRPSVYLSVKLPAGKIENTLSYLENKWKEYVPGQPFEYIFYDEKFEASYKDELKAGKLISGFSIISIIIASLGLIGLISHTAVKRTKEIGIRKVLGSSVWSIVLLLIRDFMIWVIAANLIAVPAAIYLTRTWLNGFAFRIELEPIYFISAIIASIIISVLSVSYQSIRAATANPVESLKYE